MYPDPRSSLFLSQKWDSYLYSYFIVLRICLIPLPSWTSPIRGATYWSIIVSLQGNSFVWFLSFISTRQTERTHFSYAFEVLFLFEAPVPSPSPSASVPWPFQYNKIDFSLWFLRNPLGKDFLTVGQWKYVRRQTSTRKNTFSHPPKSLGLSSIFPNGLHKTTGILVFLLTSF